MSSIPYADPSDRDVGITSSESARADGQPALVDGRSIPGLQRQQRLLDLYLFVIAACLKGGIAEWWRRAVRLPFDDIAQGVEQIRELCLHELLYGGGDVASFCRAFEILEQEGHVESDARIRFLLDVVGFVRPMIRTDLAKPSDGLVRRLHRRRRPAAVLSVIIPDHATFSRFRDLCLPTLADGNALNWFFAERAVTLIVSVREQLLSEVKAYLATRQFNCASTYLPLPDRLCDGAALHDVGRDWLIGAIQYQHLTEARRLGADFHSINPNALYASGYLKQLLRVAKGRSAVLSAVLWINNRGLADQLLIRDERMGSAAVSPLDLANLGRHVSAPTKLATFVEGDGALRGATAHLRLTRTGPNYLEIHSTCHEILFLSSAAIRAMPDRFFARPSAEVDFILAPGEQPHFVKEHDGIVIGEFRHPPGAFGDASAGLDAVAVPLSLRRTSEYFRHPIRLPVSSGTQADAEVLEVDQRLSTLFDKALKGKPADPKVHQVLTALSVLHQYEMSEYGPDGVTGAIVEGRRLIDLVPVDAEIPEVAERKALIRAAMNFDHVEKAIVLAKQGGEGTSFIHEFLSEMMELRAANVARARQMRRWSLFRRPFAVLGSIAWGDSFVAKFINYHVPSLLAEGNLPALARRRRVIHSIVTTETDRKQIIANPAFSQLSRYAEVVFTCFPEKFLEQRERDEYPFYHFYGLLDHQSVFLAAALQAELYLLPIDIVLSRHSLENLGRHVDRGADCCSVAGIECEPALLRNWLDAKGHGPTGEFDLAPGELLEAALAMPDAYARSLVMNAENRSFCRHPRELIWPEADGLSVHSIFMHPVAVSARLMARPFFPQYENVDYALLPRLLQGDGQVEVLENPVEVVAAQFGAPAGREEFLTGGFSLEAFVDAHHYNYAVQRRCFATRQFFPCKNPPYTPSNHRQAEVALIQAALKRYHFSTDDGIAT